ncbi:MAG: hypothetical protein EAZ35_02560 [Sphingobacteriia bacterium]|nr:MAG: hypothetical protein EAZ35_02560 [Sphingobacteriia bacterium]
MLKFLYSAIILLVIITCCFTSVTAQTNSQIIFVSKTAQYRPLEKVELICLGTGTVSVRDGKGKEYTRIKAMPNTSFLAGGAAGKQMISLLDIQGKLVATTSFELVTDTYIDDGGKMSSLFKILYNGMMNEEKKGYFEMKWRDSAYKMFVPWDLDNNNVMNGMQYFVPYGNGLTDLLRETQRQDGMIWSFVSTYKGGNGNAEYFETAYDPIHYFKKDKDLFFVRQPVDNHSDYNYVNMFYKHWRASGDLAWMKKTLASAALALDYCYTDTVRWSKRFQLLKRPYCIDSWDFQVDDEYTPPAPVSHTMVIVPGKTKYGVFFGDNTGYYEACNQLAEMYAFAGETDRAENYRKRGAAILKNLIALSWNGKYFTHFIEEDSMVKRNLGVDEKSQIAQGNMYSINRGLPHEINTAIIETYQKLRKNLPIGSPGEWYAIYPPFEKGFGGHDEKWQYMNGGIAGHAIGELAKGAFENGYEDYGTDILYRMLELGKKYQDKIWFSYTGSIPLPPSSPNFKSVDITANANMDLWDKGGEKSFPWMTATGAGNDMRGLPIGQQIFKNIPFTVIDPNSNQRRSVMAVSTIKNFPRQLDQPINDFAGSVYLLHASSDNTPSNIAGSISFLYSDGSEASQYLTKNQEISNWWFPTLKTERSGVAWYGPNLKSTKVGVCWAVIDNPFPAKKIDRLRFGAPLEGGMYCIAGITLANQPFYIAPKGESFGGPDNWAAANGMAALVEGLAGAKNNGLAFDKVLLSPRWTAAGIDSVNISVNLPASNGYIAYQYKHNQLKKTITVSLTGSGTELKAHFLLPKNMGKVKTVTLNQQSIPFQLNAIEKSNYVDFSLKTLSPQKIMVEYE